MIDRRAASPVLLLVAALVVSVGTSGTNTGSPLVPPLTPGGAAAESVPLTPQLDAARVAEGEALYGRYCSSFHGADLRSDPEWKPPMPTEATSPRPTTATDIRGTTPTDCS